MRSTQKPRALALVGMPGAGKSVCAEYLEAKTYFKYRFGQIIVDEVAQRGLALTPDNERIVREELRADGGVNAIAERALPRLLEALETHNSIIIDGLYGFGEYKLLNNGLGASMVVVAIVADRALRYARLTSREVRPLTVEEAIERDMREIETLEKGGPIAIADFTLLNNGTPEELYSQLETLITRLELMP